MNDAPHEQPKDKSHMLKPTEARIVLYIFAGMVVVAAMLVYLPQIQALLYPPQETTKPLKLNITMYNAMHRVFEYEHTNGAFPSKLSETKSPKDQFEAEGYRIDDGVRIEGGVITLFAYPVDKDSDRGPARIQSYVDGDGYVFNRWVSGDEDIITLQPIEDASANSPED